MDARFHTVTHSFIEAAGSRTTTKKRPFHLPSAWFEYQSWRGLKQNLTKASFYSGPFRDEMREVPTILHEGFVVQLDDDGSPVQVSKVNQITGGDMVMPLRLIYHWTAVQFEDKWIDYGNGSIILPDAKRGQTCFELVEADVLVKYSPDERFKDDRPFEGWITIQCLKFEFHGRTHLYLFDMPGNIGRGWGWQYLLICKITQDCKYDSGYERCYDCVVQYV